MKKLIVFSAVLMLASCSNQSNLASSDVPPSVMSAFQAKYPNATNTEWDTDKRNGNLVFEVDFEHEGKKLEATFKPDGTFVKEERD